MFFVWNESSEYQLGFGHGKKFGMQREGNVLPESSLPFHRAMPSMTHMDLVELERADILKFVISQV